MYNSAVEGELEATKQAKEREKEHFEAQLAQQQESARRTQDKLQVENSVSSFSSHTSAVQFYSLLSLPPQVMAGQLEALEEFRVNKERLEEEARMRVAEIERLKKEQEEMMYSLEKKAVLDRDR